LKQSRRDDGSSGEDNLSVTQHLPARRRSGGRILSPVSPGIQISSYILVTSTPYARTRRLKEESTVFAVPLDSMRRRVTVCPTAKCRFGRSSTGSR
jgi:hypothetical protein